MPYICYLENDILTLSMRTIVLLCDGTQTIQSEKYITIYPMLNLFEIIKFNLGVDTHMQSEPNQLGSNVRRYGIFFAPSKCKALLQG